MLQQEWVARCWVEACKWVGWVHGYELLSNINISRCCGMQLERAVESVREVLAASLTYHQ